MKRTILPVIICMLMFFQNAAFAQVTTSLNSVEDAYLVTFGGGQGGNSYLKFDISSIPAEATIQNAVLRVNVKSLSLGWDGDVSFFNVNSQTWTEIDTTQHLFAHLKSDSTHQDTGFGTIAGWTYSVNLMDIVNRDFSVSNIYCSILLKDPDDGTLFPPAGILVNNDDTLACGNASFSEGMSFWSKESPNPNNKPVLEITYCLPTDSTITASACTLYTLNTVDYTTSGSYSQVFTNAAGCDSTVYLELTIFGIDTTTLYESICDGEEFDFFGTTLDTSGTFYHTLLSVNSCDSVIELVLTDNPVYLFEEQDTFCFGETYLWHGETYNAAGVFYDSLTTDAGCDSVYVLALSVNPEIVVVSTVENELCSGGATGSVSVAVSGGFPDYTYNWSPSGGTNDTATGLVEGAYSCLITDQFGCVVTEMINVGKDFPIVELPTGDTIALDLVPADAIEDVKLAIESITGDNANCMTLYSGSVVMEDGKTLNDYSVQNCDHIRMYPAQFVEQEITICEGDSIEIGGEWHSSAGTYQDTLVSAIGCDTIFEISLLTDTVIFVNVDQLLCAGDSIFVEGAWQTSAGTYHDTIIAVTGCDSIIITDVSIGNTYAFTEDVSICHGTTYILPSGIEVSDSGSFVSSFTTVLGCDSLITTNVSLLPSYAAMMMVEACGDSYLLPDGATATETGAYTSMLTTVDGCDSSIVTKLFLYPEFHIVNNVQLCTNDSIYVQGAWQNTDGTYSDTTTTILGCDSIVVTNLVMTDDIVMVENHTLCFGDSLFAEDSWQTVSGVYYDTLQAAAGCDSIIVSTLNISPDLTQTLIISICDNDSVFAGGAYQDTSGTYVDFYLSAEGCDSSVTTELTVYETFYLLDAAEICSGDSILLGGDYQTDAGDYSDAYLTVSGCDSTIVTTLTVYPAYHISNSIMLCPNDSIYLEGAWQNTTGVYTDSSNTVNGCDSVVVTTLSMTDTILNYLSIVICSDDSVFAENAWQTTSGIYYDSLQATAGCDSIVITDLTVNLIYEETIDVALCDGESYTLANSNVVTDSGTYIVTLQTVLGCDSTITVILTVDPVFLTHLDTAVCLGDSVFAGDAWQLSSGQYYDTLLAVTGCDSIIETDLLILLPQTTTIDVIICNGDSVYAGGAWQDTTGTYSDLYTSMLGCDSTVVTNLSVTDTLMTIVSEGICDLDSIFLEGAWQNMAGVYTDNFVAQAGCDSTVITTLTVTTSVNAGINSLDTVCNNVTMVNLISKLDGNPDLGGTWSDDDTTGALNMGLFYPPQVTSYQEYHFTYTVSGTSPCGDSSAVLTIFVDNCTEVAEKQAVEVVVYPSVSDGEFSIGIKGANGGVVPVKVIDVTGKVVYSDQLESVSGSSTSKINLTHLSEGMYFIEFQVNGQRNTYRLVIL